jgi:sulfide dehydrogenase cytochrome subunit
MADSLLPLRTIPAAPFCGKEVRSGRLSAVILVIAFLGGALPKSQAMAADTAAAKSRNLAAACAMCHGTDGISQGGIPTIAGQSRNYLEMQLQDFRAGKRPATIMQQITKGYTDEEIGALAAYFSAQSTNSGTSPNPPGAVR